MAQRKGWDSLSPAYRARLKRNGITEKKYAGGANLAKARGKGSARKENARQTFYRQAHRAGFDAEEIQEVIDTIGIDEAMDILRFREQAMAAKDPVERYLAKGAMRNLYGQYAGLVPPAWLYYAPKG